MKTTMHFYRISLISSQNEKCFRQTLQSKSKHILCSVTFFSDNRAVYEIMRKILVDRGRPQMTIWYARIACWILKATNTLRLCNTHCFSTVTVVARTLLNFTFYFHCLCRYLSHYNDRFLNSFYRFVFVMQTCIFREVGTEFLNDYALEFWA